MLPGRILCIRTDRLGETILTLPVVTALRAAYPKAEITLLLHPDMAALLDGMPDVTDIWADDSGSTGGWWTRVLRLSGRLRAGRFDTVLVCNAKKELHAAVRLAGIPQRAGYARKWGWCLTHRVPDRKYLGRRHEVDCNLDLVRALGQPVFAPAWRMPKYLREQDQIRQKLQGPGLKPAGPVVAVHPWTSNPRKQWPAARYRELIERIGSSASVVLIGGEESLPHAPALVPDGAARITDLTGRTSLRELAAVLKDAVLLVSNDSGPVHLAAALGTKTVVLFGGEDPATGPGRWGPWGTGHTVINRPTLEAITVDEVMAAVQRHLHVRS